MTENTTTTDETDSSAEAETELGTETEANVEREETAESEETAEAEAPVAETPVAEAPIPAELIEIDEDGGDDEDEDEPASGAVSGGFGFAGLALAIVSLTTNWTTGVVTSHAQYNAEVHAPSTGLSGQQTLDMYANSWTTEAWWSLVFAAAAVLFGAGSLLSPSILLSGKNPGWAKAASTAAVIVGLVGALLAILTLTHVFGGHLTAPSAPAGSGGSGGQ